MIASKYAARTNFMLHENAEDLAPYLFIRCHVIHPLRVSNRRSKSRTPLQAAEWNYTLSAAHRRADRMSGRISFRFDGAANQQLNWSRRLAAHGSAWVERTYSPQARTDVNDSKATCGESLIRSSRRRAISMRAPR